MFPFHYHGLLLLLLLLLLLYEMDISCHRPFLPGTSLEPAVIIIIIIIIIVIIIIIIFGTCPVTPSRQYVPIELN